MFTGTYQSGFKHGHSVVNILGTQWMLVSTVSSQQDFHKIGIGIGILT